MELSSASLNRGDDRDQEMEDLRKRMTFLEKGEKERMEMKKRLETTEMEIIELQKLVKVMSMKEFKVEKANKEKGKKVEGKKELKKMDLARKKELDTKGYAAKMKKFHEEMEMFRKDLRWKMQGIETTMGWVYESTSGRKWNGEFEGEVKDAQPDGIGRWSVEGGKWKVEG